MAQGEESSAVPTPNFADFQDKNLTRFRRLWQTLYLKVIALASTKPYQTNGTVNSDQTLLNLVAGNGVALKNSNGATTISTSSAPLGGVIQTLGNNLGASPSHSGMLIVMQGDTYTLLKPPPNTTWVVFIQNTSGTATVAHNGLNIDGTAANLSLAANKGVVIFSDGANYWTMRGGS